MLVLIVHIIDGQPKKCRNYQEVKIQEQINLLPVGSVPRSIWAVLEDDMVDSCKPGDDVIITGKISSRDLDFCSEHISSMGSLKS